MAKLAIVPDVSVRFWRRVRSAIEAAVDELEPDAIATTGPPHGNHIVGMWLTHAWPDLPWIADFRDPFTIDPRSQPHGLAQVRWPAFRRFERRIYERAMLVIHNIEVEHRWARRKYPWAAARMAYLPNGCPVELEEGRIQPARTASGRQSIRAVGTSGSQESLQLARAIAALVEQGRDLELRLVGARPESADAICDLLGERAVLTGRVPHAQALAEIAGADVLVCVLDKAKSNSIALSSKLFEFLAVGVPVIAVNPTFPDRLLLKPLHGGVRVLRRPRDSDLADALAWSLSKEVKQSEHILRGFARQFNRRTQVQTLAGWLDSLAAGRPIGK